MRRSSTGSTCVSPRSLCAYSPHGSTPSSPNTLIWPNLVNRPGLDLFARPCESQLEHTIDLSYWAVDLVGSGRAEAACASGAGRRKRTTPPFCHAACLSWVLESVDIGLSRAAFVPLTLLLSSMRHHQVLCVLSACCLRFISLGFPSKPVAP